MTLRELSDTELEIFQEVNSITGLMEDQIDELYGRGIFEKYNTIFKAYSKIHKEELEALKRCVFIYWYSWCEPSCFTGIRDLDETTTKVVMNTLDRTLSENTIDDEFHEMLRHYSHFDFVFDPFPELKFIQKKMKKLQLIELGQPADLRVMNNRGQMGIYWDSIK